MALSNLIWWPWAGIGTAAPPVVAEYHPVGGPTPGDLADLPPRRGRRRRLHDIITDEEEAMTITILLIDE